MTMPNSPITDAITAAFARFDATPRDLPQDAEEITKRVNFNPHLHPRLPDGRFAPKAGGGRTLGSGPSDWGYQDGDRVKVVGKPPSSASGHGDVLGWTGRKDIFRVQLDSGDVVDLPMEHLTAADKRNDTRQIVRDQKIRNAELGQQLKDEEGNAIGNPDDWSAGRRVVLSDGSYIGRDDEYPGALFTDEPGGGVNYDVTTDDIFEFARNKQPR